MTSTVLLVFGSSFFTDIIGIHAVFGAFLAGLAIPREGGLAIAITTVVEDVVSIIFLPLVSPPPLKLTTLIMYVVLYTFWPVHRPGPT